MRFAFLIIAIVGIALAVIYPFVVQNFGGYELSRHQIYSVSDGFSPVEVELSENDAPIVLLVDFTTTANVDPVTASAGLSMSVLRNGERRADQVLEFIHNTPGENSVEAGSFVYRASGGAIHPVGAETYALSFAMRDGATLEPARIDLILMASSILWDPRIQLIGYVLMAVGVIGFVLVMVRRGGTPKQPKPPQWGRAGGDAAD